MYIDWDGDEQVYYCDKDIKFVSSISAYDLDFDDEHQFLTFVHSFIKE